MTMVATLTGGDSNSLQTTVGSSIGIASVEPLELHQEVEAGLLIFQVVNQYLGEGTVCDLTLRWGGRERLSY